jgi:hypothetical protein
MELVVGRTYTRKQIREANRAGWEASVCFDDAATAAICVWPDLNPLAPLQVLVGGQPDASQRRSRSLRRAVQCRLSCGAPRTASSTEVTTL